VGLGRRALPPAARPFRPAEAAGPAAAVHSAGRAGPADEGHRGAGESLPARRAAAGALERRAQGRSPQAHRRLPGHLSRRLPTAADPGRQDLHRTHDPAASPSRRGAAGTDRAGQGRGPGGPLRHLGPAAGPLGVHAPRPADGQALPVRRAAGDRLPCRRAPRRPRTAGRVRAQVPAHGRNATRGRRGADPDHHGDPRPPERVDGGDVLTSATRCRGSSTRK
jgi:hypothetical protein